MATKIGRSLDEINSKSKELNNSIASLTRQNKELDKSLKFNANPLEVLSKRANNTQTQINKVTERIELLKQKQAEYEKKLQDGSISQSAFDKLSEDIQKAETQLAQFNAELKKNNDTMKALPANTKFSEINSALSSAGDKISKVGSNLKGVSITAGATLTALSALSIKTVSNTAELQDYADRLGITAEALQRYDYIANQSGVDTEQLVKSVSKSRDAIGTILAGGSNASTQAIEKLFGGIENVPKDAENGFNAIIQQLSKVSDSTMQAYYANEIFGEKLATDLIPMINNGSERLDQLNAEFEQIGYLSNEQVQSLADFDDEMNIIKSSFKQTGAEITVAFLPVMEKTSDIFQNKIIPFIKKCSSFISNMSEKTLTFAVILLTLLIALSPVLSIGGKIVKLVGNFISLIPKLSGLLTGLSAHPIIAIIGVVAGLLILLYTTNEEFRESINKLFSSLMKILSVVLKPIMSIIETIAPIITLIVNIIASQLTPMLDVLNAFLQPIIWALEKITSLWEKCKNGVLKILGKGWLWGTDDDSSSSGYSTSSTINDYSLPDVSSYTQSSSIISNDTYNTNITLTATGDMDYDAKAIADAVAKEFATKKQAMGR